MATIAILLSPGALLAATNMISADQIPPLRPIRPELPPTFWEQYGGWVLLAGTGLVLLIAALAWFLFRPHPPVPELPAARARRALEPLRGKPEDGLLLSQVSQILRHYVAATFGVVAGEVTTTEFCRALIASERVGPGLSVPLTDFLRECDRRKFAPNPPDLKPLEPVKWAIGFIEQCEARLAQLAQSTGAATSGKPKPTAIPPSQAAPEGAQ